MNNGAPSGIATAADVAAQGLCTQCGVCASACPFANIRIKRDAHWRYVPEITDAALCREKCSGICVQVCGGVHEDTALWNMPEFARDSYQEWLLGKIRSVRIGYAADAHIRLRGSSGGVVTALLLYLLENKIIDGALVIGAYDPARGEHVPFIARTPAELASAWGSKYYPMPLGLHFRNMMNSGEKYAVVLMGCHMRSLRRMEQRFPALKRAIVLRIGLICGYCSGFKAVLDQAREWGIADFSEVTALNYRKGLWPGNFHIGTLRGDREQVIYDFLLRLPFTTNIRCMVCSDLMNDCSDITVGDAWLPEFTGKRDAGWSIAALRSPEAEEMVDRAMTGGALKMLASNPETFARSQEKPLRYKKTAFRVRRDYVEKRMKLSVPAYDFQQGELIAGMRPNFWNRLGNRWFMGLVRLFFPRDRLRRFVYRRFPASLIRRCVRFIFLMIAHDGKTAFWRKWLRRGEPVLNSDA